MHGTDDEDSNYEEDAEDDIEDKLTDLMGESNMSNMPNPCRRPGDVVMIVPCPEHEVDLRANTGFFIMDLSIIAKMTETELQTYLRELSEIKGCIGEDCTISLEEALDDAEKPQEVLKKKLKDIENLNLPIGWTKASSPQRFTEWIAKIVGLIFTAFAVSLGAPFWFDILNKLSRLRGSGRVPKKLT